MIRIELLYPFLVAAAALMVAVAAFTRRGGASRKWIGVAVMLAATGVWYGLATWAIPDLLGRAFEGEDLGRFGQVVRSLGRPYVDRYWRHAADLGLILLGAGTA